MGGAGFRPSTVLPEVSRFWRKSNPFGGGCPYFEIQFKCALSCPKRMDLVTCWSWVGAFVVNHEMLTNFISGSFRQVSHRTCCVHEFFPCRFLRDFLEWVLIEGNLCAGVGGGGLKYVFLVLSHLHLLLIIRKRQPGPLLRPKRVFIRHSKGWNRLIGGGGIHVGWFKGKPRGKAESIVGVAYEFPEIRNPSVSRGQLIWARTNRIQASRPPEKSRSSVLLSQVPHELLRVPGR